MAARKYTEKKRKEVLAFLKENEHSYYRASKKFKISINTIKNWDDYPNNVPKEAMLRIAANKAKQKKKSSQNKSQIKNLKENEQELPEDIVSLISIALEKSLKRVIILIDTISTVKEISYITKAVVEMSKIPSEFRAKNNGKSVLETLLERYERESKGTDIQ